MSGVTGKPILGCNLSCHGCYEGAIFERGEPEPYDLDAFIEGIRNGPSGTFTLHGGEPLLMPLDDVRRVFEACRAMGRPIAIQSNFTIVTARTLDLLEEFNVSVGVSLNGPDELNQDRASVEVTRRVHQNIRAARERGLDVGIITVLSTTNAGYPRDRARLIEWAAELGHDGVREFRFNPLFNGGDRELTPDQLVEVYRDLAEATLADPSRSWRPIRDWVNNLLGFGVEPCWMNPCDPYHTDAVYAVFGHGEVGNCLRTAQDGIAYLRHPQAEYVRQDILYQIPFEHGGCGGCRYWNLCHGGCPAEGVDGDWRNRSRWCQAIQATYRFLEQRLKGMLPHAKLVPDMTDEEGLAALDDMLNRRRPFVLEREA